jgi:hypothetical protein
VILKVCLQKLPRTLVQQLGFGAGTLLRGEGPPLAVDLHAALERGDAHAEGAGGLEDLLLAQVFGVGIHPSMVSYSPTPLQAAALGYVLWLCLTEDLKQEIEAVLLGPSLAWISRLLQWRLNIDTNEQYTASCRDIASLCIQAGY